MMMNPIGSDGFFNFTPWSLYIIAPISVWGFYLMSKEMRGKKHNEILGLSILLLFVFTSLNHIRTTAYFDPGNRSKKIHSIQSIKARLIFTTKTKAKMTNDIINAIEKTIPSSGKVIVYNSAPMLHYLTNRKPVMDNSWIWVYDTESFRLKLLDLINSEDKYYIVLQKINTIGGETDRPFAPLNDTISDNWFHRLEKRELFAHFVSNKNFYKVWENENFTILKN